tara:strand:- start:353 stop:766 length:414 start_codon:yes stop_codon:yes gene_type:complete
MMDIGDKIKCHGNLNKGCLSVVPKGSKTELYYDTIVVIVGAEFKCSAAGHKRIVERKCRSVVADVHGVVSDIVVAVDGDTFADDGQYMQVSYNPVKHPDRPYFYDVDGVPVSKVETAYIVTSATIDSKAKTRAYIRR